MKRRLLEDSLGKNGATFFRHGGNHDIWHLADGSILPVPRHADIDERLAKSMIKKAKKANSK